MTTTEICNLALLRIGEPAITDIAGTGTVPEICNLVYAQTVRELLRGHRWNFATKRTVLEPAQVTPTGIAESSDGEYEITKSGHGLATGQRVTFIDSANYSGINGTWRVTVSSSSVFTLDDSDFDGSGAVDFTYALAGVTEWAYSIALPSDCLRALEDDRQESDSAVRWVVEAGRVLTDELTLEFKYIADETDPDVYGADPLFVNTLSLTLAIKIETALRGDTGSAGLKSELAAMMAPLAKRVDANEGQPRERLFPFQSLFVRARSAGL